MAIAGIVLQVTQGRLPETREALRALAGVVDVQGVEDDAKLAVVLESPSRTLQADLEALRAIAHVLQLDVAYVNYEEDLDDQGRMPCPEHAPRPCKSPCKGGAS